MVGNQPPANSVKFLAIRKFGLATYSVLRRSLRSLYVKRRYYLLTLPSLLCILPFMMQITHICITRGFRVPESQFDRKTSFQTRLNPPGDALPQNVDSGARLSRGTTPVLYTGTNPDRGVAVPAAGSAGVLARARPYSTTPVLCPCPKPIGPWLLGPLVGHSDFDIGHSPLSQKIPRNTLTNPA